MTQALHWDRRRPARNERVSASKRPRSINRGDEPFRARRRGPTEEVDARFQAAVVPIL